jgi:hypothetical protein
MNSPPTFRFGPDLLALRHHRSYYLCQILLAREAEKDSLLAEMKSDAIA